MTIRLRFSKKLDDQIREDLGRPHKFALERVGFISAKHICLARDRYIVFLTEYLPVSDEDYICDNSVGARINGTAIRKAMQCVLDTREGMFHVHTHPFGGIPSMSLTDKAEIPAVVRNFRNVCATSVNGILLLSPTHYKAYVNLPQDLELISTTDISVVGFPMNLNL